MAGIGGIAKPNQLTLADDATINKSDADIVIIGIPIDPTRVLKIKKPSLRVRYELQEIGQPTLEYILKQKFGKNSRKK
jgi:predicted GTPase